MITFPMTDWLYSLLTFFGFIRDSRSICIVPYRFMTAPLCRVQLDQLLNFLFFFPLATKITGSVFVLRLVKVVTEFRVPTHPISLSIETMLLDVAIIFWYLTDWAKDCQTICVHFEGFPSTVLCTSRITCQEGFSVNKRTHGQTLPR